MTEQGREKNLPKEEASAQAGSPPPPGDERTELAKRLGFSMRRLHRHVSSRVMREMQGELQGLDLSFSQVTALHQLRAAPHLTVTQLSERTHLSLAAVSQLAERLVRRGLARREENPDNRREKRLTLTPAGEAAVARLDAGFVEAYVATFAALDPGTLAATESQLSALLDELERSLEDPA